MSRLWVIIPAYNEESGIGATLNALATQHDPDFTLVVVDNGSRDRTVAVVERFARQNPGMRVHIVDEPEKGTGASADTGMRFAVARGAGWLARTDADCVPTSEWTARLKAAFGEGLELVAGQLLPRTDENVSVWRRWVLVGAVEFAAAAGKIRPDNRHPRFLGPYVMAPGCNMGITSDLYLSSGGFPRTKIEDVHEDRALVNAVRVLTSNYGLRRDVVVRGSTRRVQAWGLRKTLAWYADHRYSPTVVDIR